MAKSKRRREKGGDAEEHSDHERWLLTYADMITLLMAFFIMMYAMSLVNVGKFSELAVSVRSGFGGDAPGMGTSVLGLTMSHLRLEGVLPAGQSALLKQVETDVRERLKRVGLSDSVQMEMTDRGLVLHLPADGLLFDRGSAELKPTTRQVLAAIAPSLQTIPNDVRIEGHTCDLPIRSLLFPSNWELSARRATNVLVAFITSHDLPPARMAAVGHGPTRPLAPNTRESNRKRNRRVDIVVVAEKSAPPVPVGGPSGTKQYLNYLGSAAYEMAAELDTDDRSE
jgi:chemotaxis protein MotB